MGCGPTHAIGAAQSLPAPMAERGAGHAGGRFRQCCWREARRQHRVLPTRLPAPYPNANRRHPVGEVVAFWSRQHHRYCPVALKRHAPGYPNRSPDTPPQSKGCFRLKGEREPEVVSCVTAAVRFADHDGGQAISGARRDLHPFAQAQRRPEAKPELGVEVVSLLRPINRVRTTSGGESGREANRELAAESRLAPKEDAGRGAVGRSPGCQNGEPRPPGASLVAVRRSVLRSGGGACRREGEEDREE